MKKELIFLMTGMTKGGKTSIATALCHPNCRDKMVALGNCRTQVTVDWTFDPDAEKITLMEVLLNYKAVFGTAFAERISCVTFNEILTDEKNKFLKEVLGLEKQENLTGEELERYVLGRIVEFVNASDEKELSNLISNRASNRFIRRIKVSLPPVDEFFEILKKNKISLVLRDTRGLLDLDPDEANEAQYRTKAELGLDGIDAALVLGTSAEFPDTTEWYKRAYKEAFEAVPIFIMARAGALWNMFEKKYGTVDGNLNTSNIQNFLECVKGEEAADYERLRIAYIPCYRLLEKFDLGKIYSGDFEFFYRVYKKEELRYVYPESVILAMGEDKLDYTSPDYRFYERIVFSNLADMIGKVLEHNQFVDAIHNLICYDFADTLQKGENIAMVPDYQVYDRTDVCNRIVRGPILGPRDGIVTMEHGKVKYLGAVTSAVSARVWMRSNVYGYVYPGVLQNPDGTDLAPNMTKACRDNLVRMTLFKIIEASTDTSAYFRGYYFVNRFLVWRAIDEVRRNDLPGDALDHAIREIAKLVFPLSE